MSNAKRYFTKSAFKIACHCPMQAYYSKNSDYAYHSPFPEGSAEVGDQFGELARIIEKVPSCNNINSLDYDISETETKTLMAANKVDIAEAAFRYENLFVRVDILHKNDSKIELIEVKSKTVYGDVKAQGNENFAKNFSEYLLDIAFQKYVVQKALNRTSAAPKFEITAKLMFIDSERTLDIKNLSAMLKIKYDSNNRRFIECSPEDRDFIENNNVTIHRTFDVTDICDKIINDEISLIKSAHNETFKNFVKIQSELFVSKIIPTEHCKIDKDCFKCPYYATEKELKANKKCGKTKCFKDILGIDIGNKPLIGDLKGSSKSFPSSIKSSWRESKKIFLEDLDEYEFIPATKATEKSFLERKELTTKDLNFLHVHSVKTKNSSPLFLKDAARKEMSFWDYPLHFIDFETYQGAIPLFKGNHPNEEICYQFSHHIGYKDGHYEHAGEFICLESGKFPNFDFIRELKKQLEQDGGTVFRYDSHENTCLNAILIQLQNSHEKDADELIEFIKSIAQPTKKNEGLFTERPRHMRDLKDICQKFFYHPDMGGSNSIKDVLPAILKSHEYFASEDMDPYHNLPKLSVFTDEVISELEASGKTREQILAEQFDDSDVFKPDLQINQGGISKLDYILLNAKRFNKLHTEAIRRAALKYCELDTLAMVRIWEYFKIMTKE